MGEPALKQVELAPEPDREPGLFVTDEELYKLLGVPRDTARAAIAMYDRDPHSGFPKKNALWGGRRYWPAVKAFFDRQNRVTLSAAVNTARQPNDR